MSKPQKITAQVLRAWLADAPGTVAVVDVRDDDRIGGHIKSSINVPSSIFHSSLAALDARVAGVPRVVFHCQLSQVRGPSCASTYWRHTYNENTVTSNSSSTDSVSSGDGQQQQQQQQIYVLKGGFSEWAQFYGMDSAVTESFRPELYR